MNILSVGLHNPLKILKLWVAFHLIVWSVVPWLTNTALPLDSIEAVLWGFEMQWGYDKHPPLSGWLAYIFASGLGDFGVYFLSQLCVVVAGLGVFRVARYLKMTEVQSVLAVIVLECISFYNYSSVEFNVNILQLPFWTWGWFFGMDALDNKKMRSWIALGLCVGLGALAKYVAVFLLVPLFVFWWQRGQLRKALFSAGLSVAGVVSMLVFLPHLLWMRENDWMTITYGLDRSGSGDAPWWARFWYPVQYLFSQIALLIAVVVLVLMIRKRSERVSSLKGASALAFAAYIAMALLSLIIGMKPVTMWAVPFPLAIGVWVVSRYQAELSFVRVMKVSVFMALLSIIAYSVVYGLGPRLRSKPHRVNYPATEIASRSEGVWHQLYGSGLPYVIADEWFGGIINFYGRDKARVMIEGELARSPYLSDVDVVREGALILWMKSRDASSTSRTTMDHVFPDIRERYPQLIEKEDLVIPWPRRSDGKEGRYGVALIPPAAK